jgi:hypothetical protein
MIEHEKSLNGEADHLNIYFLSYKVDLNNFTGHSYWQVQTGK